MVTDDKVYSLFLGIGYLFDCFDATIEDDNKFNSSFFGKVYSLFAYSITLIIAVGDVVIDV